MVTKEELLAYADSLTGAGHDCPFENDFDTTVLRHKDTGKWFGLVFRAPRHALGLSGEGYVPIINLKSLPENSLILRELYADIYPGYHMNHMHWITIPLESQVPKEVVLSLVKKSYTLTKKKTKKAE